MPKPPSVAGRDAKFMASKQLLVCVQFHTMFQFLIVGNTVEDIPSL
jgi:hypothetical protein